MWTMLAGVPGKLKTLIDRLTATRAANLDKLDANITTRAPASTALSNAVWSDARAGKLDSIGLPVSPMDRPVLSGAPLRVGGSGARSSVGTSVLLDVTGPGILHRLTSNARANGGNGTVTGNVIIEIDGVSVTIARSQFTSGTDQSNEVSHVGDVAWLEHIPFYTSLKVSTQIVSMPGGGNGSISATWIYRRVAP